MARTRISLTTILGIEDPTMHHAPLTAQQRTQYLAARLHHPRMPAHRVLATLRTFRLWYSAGADMHPAKVPSVRQCIVTKAVGEVKFVAGICECSARDAWRAAYRVARMHMR